MDSITGGTTEWQSRRGAGYMASNQQGSVSNSRGCGLSACASLTPECMRVFMFTSFLLRSRHNFWHHIDRALVTYQSKHGTHKTEACEHI